MKIKLNENLSRHLKAALVEAGYDAATALEQGLNGKSDRELSAAARNEGRMVFTLDLEFADLRKFPPGGHPGVVVFRPHSLGPLAVNAFIRQFASTTNLEDLAGCTVIVEPDRVRVRWPQGQE